MSELQFNSCKTALLLCVLLTQSLFAQMPLEVMTDSGAIKGAVSDDTSVTSFLGLPYAAAPVGQNRWRLPQSVTPWSGTRGATTPAPACISTVPETGTGGFRSEDCLYVDVWSGASSTDDSLPVLVWLDDGENSDSGRISGEILAGNDLVVVTVSYRLGAFGYFAHPLLSRESPQGASGNYALHDVLQALQWVQVNVAQFGGNPGNVTLMGKDVAGSLVSSLIAVPAAEGLFTRAVVESGPFMGPDISVTPELSRHETEGKHITELFGYESLEVMRSLPASEVQHNFPEDDRPIIDGQLIPKDLALIFSAGEQLPVDLLAGSRRNEPQKFGLGIRPREEFIEMALHYGDQAEEFFGLYPAENDEQAIDSWSRAASDAIAWQMGLLARYQSETGRRAWVYLAESAADEAQSIDAENSRFSSSQSSFNTLADYLINFVQTAENNRPDLAEWIKLQGDDGIEMVLKAGHMSSAGDVSGEEYLSFYNKAYQNLLIGLSEGD